MTRRLLAAVVGFLAVAVPLVVGIAVQAAFDAQRQSEPPHVERPEADVRWQAAAAAQALAEWQADAALYAAQQQHEIEWAAFVAAQEEERERATSRAPVPQGGQGAAPSSAPSGAGGCGQDWDCFRECTFDHESRSSGLYGAVSPDGVYRGAYQYLGSTWRSVAVNAGHGEWADTPADQVPPEVQDAVARFHWESAGTRPWGGRCG